MFVVKCIFILFIVIKQVKSESHDGSDNSMIGIRSNYKGDKFPIKYLTADHDVPTIVDLDRYLNHIQRSITYFGHFLNKTDCNVALCLLLSKSLLKRTLLDGRSKLQPSHITLMKKLINDAENIVSHYVYVNSFYDWRDLEYRFTRLFQNEAILVYNIGEFNNDRLQPWILRNEYMNEYVEEIDEGTLPKEKYIELVEAMSDFSIGLEDSDECISRVAYNPMPLDEWTLRPCLPDAYCEGRLMSTPSVAYALSHRMLNIFARLRIRNCYIMSVAKDIEELDKLCAFMYREAVYIARRGFFSRDLFLEHITLCALMGYREFHRKHWFDKALSWMNDVGCMKEFRNFELNRTKIVRDMTDNNPRDMSDYMKMRCNTLHSLCDHHPSGLLLAVLSHAVRYTVHFMQLT